MKGYTEMEQHGIKPMYIFSMAQENVVVRFSDVSFEYERGRALLDEVSFSVRAGSRITLMGQNGAGKSTICKLITKELIPTSGKVFITPPDATIAIARQVMPPAARELTIRAYFGTAFTEEKYNLDKLVHEVCEIVNLSVPAEKKVGALSGGQQARLLLAHALIQHPDILILDEPTNNLDQTGIDHLTTFLIMYEKTCIVISHDADFLNAFSDGVLYLDAFTQKVEQYTGNYHDVVEEISVRIERENLQNARMQAQIKEKRAQAEVFAHKGGKLRAVAKRMRESAEEAEENIVQVRREDKTIRAFAIPAQEFDPHFGGKVLQITAVEVFRDHVPTELPLDMTLRKGTHVLVAGPNGIGKSTLLERLARRSAAHAAIAPEVVIGYYKQDFSNLDVTKIAYEVLREAMKKDDEHMLRSTAAGFLLDGKLLAQPVGALSEGQKGLLAFCRLVLLRPGLLILDEPTNHINFRHIPVIAQALDEYEGALIMVSHHEEFVSQVRIDEIIDLAKKV